MPERKYALTKIAAGDYLLPSNDGKKLWRIAVYEDGPSHGLDTPRDRSYWGVWRWTGDVGEGSYVDTTDWSQWDLWCQSHDTRAAAINAALKEG